MELTQLSPVGANTGGAEKLADRLGHSAPSLGVAVRSTRAMVKLSKADAGPCPSPWVSAVAPISQKLVLTSSDQKLGPQRFHPLWTTKQAMALWAQEGGQLSASPTQPLPRCMASSPPSATSPLLLVLEHVTQCQNVPPSKSHPLHLPPSSVIATRIFQHPQLTLPLSPPAPQQPPTHSQSSALT